MSVLCSALISVLSPGPVYLQDFSGRAKAYCNQVFGGRLSGNWDKVAARWAAANQQQDGGVPADDSNNWADSCPQKVRGMSG